MTGSLLSLFNSPAHQATYRYILLDQLGQVSELSYLYCKKLQETLAPQHIAILPRPELAYNLAKCPQLICIAEPNGILDEKLLLDSLDQALHEQLFRKHYVCGWLASKLAPQQLAQQLTELGSAMGRLFMSQFIPFYEPFRMQILDDMNALCPQWLMHSLGMLCSYAYVDVTNQLRIHQPALSSHSDDHYFVTEELKFYQQEAEPLFQLYLGWFEINKRQGHTLQQPDFIELLNCYRKAWRIGLTEITDGFAYVYDTLKYGELEKNEMISRAITAAINAPGTLVKQLSAIDEAYFLSLRHDKLGYDHE